jgi:hypothetical protein
MNSQMLAKASERGFVAIVNERICAYSTLKAEPIEFLLALALNTYRRYPALQFLIPTLSGFSVKIEKNYHITATMAF